MTSDKTHVTADLLTEQNLKKQRVSEGSLPSEVTEVIGQITSLEAAGIYNLVGKDRDVLTDVAWGVAVNDPEWEYVPWPSPAETLDSERVIVDNVAATREASRRVREIRTFDGANIVVAVSRKPIPEITNTIGVEYNE
jgi:hypothetical protein